jgi:hypothetical protein
MSKIIEFCYRWPDSRIEVRYRRHEGTPECSGLMAEHDELKAKHPDSPYFWRYMSNSEQNAHASVARDEEQGVAADTQISLSSPIDFTNAEQMTQDAWLFLTSDKMPEKATVKKEAFDHEVGCMLELMKGHYETELERLHGEREDLQGLLNRIQSVCEDESLDLYPVGQLVRIESIMCEYEPPKPQQP